MSIRIKGPPLAVRTCAERLSTLARDFGDMNEPKDGERQTDTEEVLLAHPAWPSGAPDIECDISWHPPGPRAGLPGSEAMLQATCGIAHLHGLERGHPRRVGLDIASVAAGILASQALLAAMVAGRRGRPASSVQLSVTQAALLTISQYIARATSSDAWSDWLPVSPGPEPGPPFRTSDGHWVELETLDHDSWTRFWVSLGVDRSRLGRAWTLFHARYSAATCSMPEGFHQAIGQQTLAQISELAGECGISLCPVRSYEEVLREPGIGASEFPILGFPSPLSGTSPPPLMTRSTSTADGSAGESPSLPLTGIRVVEATSRIQGPLAGQLLRMLGADIVRIEPPGGDPNRLSPPTAGDTGALFLCVNRGKQGVELDLASRGGRDELADLVADADVFFHNWRPGKAGEWHLEFEELSVRNPALVYCAASGWGTMAPKCPPIGMEFLVQAYAGLGNGIQPEDEPPLPSRLLLTDVMGALVACEGILAGLYRRERQGRGGHVDTSLLTGAMALQAHVLHGMAAGPRSRRRRGRPVWNGLETALQAADGHIFVTVSDQEALSRLCALCGLGPRRHVDGQLEQALRKRLVRRPATEWQSILLAAGITCGVVCADLRTLVTDPATGNCLEPVQGAWMPARPWRFQ